MTVSDKLTTRRKVLASAGSVATLGLAGCMGGVVFHTAYPVGSIELDKSFIGPPTVLVTIKLGLIKKAHKRDYWIKTLYPGDRVIDSATITPEDVEYRLETDSDLAAHTVVFGVGDQPRKLYTVSAGGNLIQSDVDGLNESEADELRTIINGDSR